MKDLASGFYWVRMVDRAERQTYWSIKLYDGKSWTSLSIEGKQPAPDRASLGNSYYKVVGPLSLPDSEGRIVEMWKKRSVGFYWMRGKDWPPHIDQWSICEFNGEDWRWMDTDELSTDNDMQRYPVVGPIPLPLMAAGGAWNEDED